MAQPSYDDLLRTSQDLSIHAFELDIAVAKDEVVRMRHAFASQRRVRVCGALLLGAIATWLVRANALAVVGTVACVLTYLAMMWLAWRVIRNEQTNESTFRGAIMSMLAIDAITLSVLGILAGSAAAAIVLVPGIILSAAAAFFYGRKAGFITGTIVATGYAAGVVIDRAMLGPVLGRAGADWGTAAASLVVFVAMMAVVVRSFGAYRRRVNALRRYCKLGELGDAPVTIPIDPDRAPDDLTLLAGSIETMRWRLGEQVGSDPLTGCANRRTFEARLLTDWRHARRRHTSVAVAAVDIDHFKQINDTRGHPVGDLVLQQVASIMLTTARDTDTVARLGGDEFVIVLPDTDHEGALAFAERLRSQVMEFTFGPPGDALGITISVGTAVGSAGESIEPVHLMTAADRSLYRAKAGGRNRVCD